MAKNRDYTGLARTPSSMAWLIFQRSRVQGVIDRLQKTLDEAPAKIAQCQLELTAIDAVIPMHEVQVQPAQIVGRRPRTPNLLPWGSMKRHALNYLREAPGPVYTVEIATYIARVEKINFETCSLDRLVNHVRHVLTPLVNQGVVTRHHALRTTDMGLWSLASKGSES